MPKNEVIEGLDLDQYKYDFRTEGKAVFRTEPDLTEDVVRAISAHKDEPEWMLEFRLKAFRAWQKMTEPTWHNLKIDPIDYQALSYYSAPKKKPSSA